jgi:hypothetical protein
MVLLEQLLKLALRVRLGRGHRPNGRWFTFHAAKDKKLAGKCLPNRY